MKKILIAVLPLFAIIACQKDPQVEQTKPATYTVSGKVEKGPFIQGSSISMATLDAKLNASGKNYTATITDDAGTFSFGSQEFDSPYARLTATGYFYNEVSRQLSNGTLTLSALVDLSDKQSVNVNLLTHLKALRIQKLITSGGKSFKEASSTAQTELLKAFGYEKFSGTDVSQFSITAGTDEAAALIIISSEIQIGRSEAQITEFISKLATDFAENGTFSTANQEALASGLSSLYTQLDGIREGIVERYSTLGIYVTVKDLKSYVDWDGDGIPGNEFLKEGDKVTLSQEKIEAPAEGGTFTIEIDSPIAVFLSKQTSEGGEVNPISSIGDGFYDTFYADGGSVGMSFTKSLEGKTLTVIIDKSKVRKENSETIDLYAYDGTVVATLPITQAAAEKCDFVGLGESGQALVNATFSNFAQAVATLIDGDKYYTGRAYHPNLKAPIDPSYSGLYNCWSYCYQFANRIAQARDIDLHMRGIYTEYFDLLSAINYYNMVVFWGGVPYITAPSSGEVIYYPRTAESDILTSLIENLEAAVKYADKKRNVAVAMTADELLFQSKDVARIALADIYMYQGKYDKALPLLEDVEATEHYSLDSADKPCSSSADCILAVNGYLGTKSAMDDGQYKVIYCYADVLLSISECCFKLDNQTKAVEHLNMVAYKYGCSTSNDILTDISLCRKELNLPGYFAFLKRTGLAKQELSLEDYQLLWPIPWSEMMSNPNMTQNPGY